MEQAPIAEADAARDARNWPAAAALYEQVVRLCPHDAGMWTQLGHVRRENAEPAAARAAYARAVALDGADAELHLYLGHAHRLCGEPVRAAAAYARALDLRPGWPEPARELAALDAAPSEAARALRAHTPGPAHAAARLAEGLGAITDWQATAGYAPADWDRFVREIPLRPPPGPLPVPDDLLILVGARNAAPADVRATLLSLHDQSVRGWRAAVSAPPGHPAAALADHRTRFAEDQPLPAAATVLLDAGTRLHPEALAWLLFALDRTGAPAAVADHDRAHPDPWGGERRADPRLTPGDRPPLLAIRGSAAHADRGTLLRAAARVAHVPRVLATLPTNPPRPSPGPAPAAPAGQARTQTIAVVVPTRTPDLLARALAALTATAAAAHRVRPVAVSTGAPFDPPPGTALVSAPGPFNWSRANNLGAAAQPAADLFLFLNDDVELLSPGWDDALDRLFADRQVGAVGARLLYPDGTVQHAGVVFGCGEHGRPLHEGRGAAAGDPGPDGRWLARRPAAAVTGAFLATSRAWFARAGGFDEALAVAYNDLDFCLRVRAARGLVLYEPAIEAIHREGATRGRAASPEQAAWDDAELADLRRRWGPALAHDPGLHPHWARTAPPLTRLREPPMRELLARIDRSASPHPWLPARTET